MKNRRSVYFHKPFREKATFADNELIIRFRTMCTESREGVQLIPPTSISSFPNVPTVSAHIERRRSIKFQGLQTGVLFEFL